MVHSWMSIKDILFLASFSDDLDNIILNLNQRYFFHFIILSRQSFLQIFLHRLEVDDGIPAMFLKRFGNFGLARQRPAQANGIIVLFAQHLVEIGRVPRMHHLQLKLLLVQRIDVEQRQIRGLDLDRRVVRRGVDYRRNLSAGLLELLRLVDDFGELVQDELLLHFVAGVNDAAEHSDDLL